MTDVTDPLPEGSALHSLSNTDLLAWKARLLDRLDPAATDLARLVDELTARWRRDRNPASTPKNASTPSPKSRYGTPPKAPSTGCTASTSTKNVAPPAPAPRRRGAKPDTPSNSPAASCTPTTSAAPATPAAAAPTASATSTA